MLDLAYLSRGADGVSGSPHTPPVVAPHPFEPRLGGEVEKNV